MRYALRDREPEHFLKRVTDRVKLLRQGDVLTFDPVTFVLEGWRSHHGVVLDARCPWVEDEQHFKDLVRLMGLVADPKLTSTIREEVLPQSLWAYRYI